MKHIVIFDPDTKHLSSFTSLLKKKNYSVHGFNAIEKAIIHIKNSKSDIIFLRLPEGLKTKYLNLLNGNIPHIGILEKEKEDVIKKAFKAGIEEFIISPYTASEVKLKIKYCLEKKHRTETIEKEKNSLNEIEDILKTNKIAIFLLEPILGECGDCHLRQEYLKEVRFIPRIGVAETTPS